MFFFLFNVNVYLGMVQLDVAVLKTLHSTHGKKKQQQKKTTQKLSIETEKSEQTLFAQISLSQY